MVSVHALTIDLEDWHQLVHRRATGQVIGPTPAVVADTHRALDLLDEASARATFFVVGGVAEAYPDLVREVARRGHEVGSHSYSHRPIYDLTPETFRQDVQRSMDVLAGLTGKPVLGFRAPEFSVQRLDHWSFSVLAEVGIRYDSSVFPTSMARYGIPNAPRGPFLVETGHGTVREFPLATWPVGGRQLPIAGGSYFRLLPVKLLRRALQEGEAHGQVAVLYFHPYEFHRGWLTLARNAYLDALKHGRSRAALAQTALHNFGTPLITQRLRRLLDVFHFTSLEACHRSLGWSS